MASLFEEFFAALQEGGSTPWAQEALRRMSAGQDLSGIDEELAQRRPRQKAAPASIPRQAPPPSADVRNPGTSPDPFASGDVRMGTNLADINAGASPRAPDGVSGASPAMAPPQPVATPAPSVGRQPPVAAPDFSSGVSPLVKFLGLDKLGIDGGERARIQKLAFDSLVQKGIPANQAELYVRQPQLLAQIVPKLVAGPEKPTDEMREYIFDQQQRKQADPNHKVVPFGQWKADLKKAGAQTVSIDQRGQSAFEQGVGKAQAERLDGFMKGAQAARDQIASLDAAQAAIDEFNKGGIFGTGKLGEGEATLRGYARAIGVGNADTLGAAELVRATQNQMALQMRNPDGGMGMPGALSDADREFLRASQPGLDKSPEGNRRMIEIQKRLAQRKIEVASMAERYAQQNRSLTGFEDVVAQHFKDKPLFADIQAPKVQPSGAAPRNGQFKILGVR